MIRGLSGCSVLFTLLLTGPAQARVQTPVGVAASHHPERAVPSLLWATTAPPAPAGSTPEQAARFHLTRVREAYGVSREALDGARLLFVHDTGRGGIIVALRQTVGGVDVLRGDLKVLLDRGLHLVAVAGSPHPAAVAPVGPAHAFATPAARVAAVAAALRDRYGLELAAHLSPSREPARAGHQYLDLAAPGPVDLQLRRPARVKPVLYPVGDALVPAHRVEIQAERGRTRDALAWVIAADGRVLERRDLIAHESFNYRVFADADGRPLDSPLPDYSPHPTGLPEGGPVGQVAPTLVAVEGFNTNPEGTPDPWLPPGASETLGNNIDAYADHANPSGLSLPLGDFRAAVSAPGTFDYAYDTTLEPLATDAQSMAAITSLFYTTNWLHDWWYDSGFNEAAGNAQTSNYGRGGAEGDALLAEGQDAVFAGARDNANMLTPEDGEPPVMQMYLYSPLHKELHFTTTGPDADFEVGQASFGPRTYDVTAPLVLVEDGAGKSPTDGCEPPLNDLTGKIALIDRGTCTFEVKAAFAQAAGAVGVVFPDTLPNMGAYPPGPPDPKTEDPTIPGQGLSKADGVILKAALLNGPVTGHMVGLTTVERDGTIDNLIVAHEFGHLVHHRLVDCGSQQCGAQSEGWGDFLALMLALRDGDDLDATYASSYYGTTDTTAYTGGRRTAYSVDKTKDALTFKHIAVGEALPPPPLFFDNGYPNNEVHNAGEVWSTMMWEAYIALRKAHLADESFEETHRRMSDYVVAGMMMAPASPTVLEQRDGLLAAAFVADPADFAALARGFANRGAGTCAVGPGKDSIELTGVVEDFEVRSKGEILLATLDDATRSCDGDGLLDDEEAGLMTVTVRNVGTLPMAGATLKATPASAAIELPDGDTLMVPELAPQTEVALTFAVLHSGASIDAEHTAVALELSTPDGCATVTQFSLPAILDGDLAEHTSQTDDVESPAVVWTTDQPPEEDVWSRAATPESYVWHARDLGRIGDGRLVSPELHVALGEPFTVTFEHAHEFESSPPSADPNLPITHFDGALIELSNDGGKTWGDVDLLVDDPGYNGPINSPSNPLSGRLAFVGKNPAHPARDTVTLDFGTALADQTVQLRFRVGSDLIGGAPGWDIDNITFTGITNKPFASYVPDASTCEDPNTPTTSASSSDDGGESGDVPTTGGVDDSTGSSGGSMENPVGDEGCGCTSSRSGGLLPLLALLALPRRRRRRA